MNKKEEEKLKNLKPPKSYHGEADFEFSIKHCPGYEGYIPDNLDHEICKYCGSISYYH